MNKKYIPYYKWVFKALRSLDRLAALGDDLEHLISSPNTETDAKVKTELIEKIAACVIDELEDPKTRNLHIMYAV